MIRRSNTEGTHAGLASWWRDSYLHRSAGECERSAPTSVLRRRNEATGTARRRTTGPPFTFTEYHLTVFVNYILKFQKSKFGGKNPGK